MSNADQSQCSVRSILLPHQQFDIVTKDVFHAFPEDLLRFIMNRTDIKFLEHLESEFVPVSGGYRATINCLSIHYKKRKKEHAVEAILTVLEARFQTDVAEKLKPFLSTIDDLQRLEHLTRIAAQASNIDVFTQALLNFEN